MAETLNLEDIQGLIIYGYGNLTAACYVLLEISNPDAAKSWLSSIASTITASQSRPEKNALNIAFTPTGLQKLGLGPEVLAMFSTEFLEGMATPHRSRILGDVEESAPEHWQWGNSTTPSIDMSLMLFADNDQDLSATYTTYAQTFAANGLVEVKRLDTVNLGFIEHFGFHDGISQPVMAGLPQTEIPMNTIQNGEFLLGYLNEYGLYTERPLIKPASDPKGLLPDDAGGSGNKDLGRNGGYLVFRQLHQDVRGFWQFLDRATKNANGSSNAAARTKLAAKMIGRWPSGAPLVKAPDQDDPKLEDCNDFTYHQDDLYGRACPLGAHIRRAHTRDSLDPAPGTEKSTAVSKHHRILRRGREYGKPINPEDLFSTEPPADEEQDRGLHFICVCANISRQFEFIQHTWLNNPNFNGLYDDTDPIIGARQPDGGTFIVQANPVRERVSGLPRFVSVLGGAYFFMPGIKAIRYIASPDASA